MIRVLVYAWWIATAAAPFAAAGQGAAPIPSATAGPPSYADLDASLPPTLERFSAVAVDCGTHFQWTVSERADASEYRVLASRNGRDYVTVGALAEHDPQLAYELEVPTEEGTTHYELVELRDAGALVVLARQSVAVTCARVASSETP